MELSFVVFFSGFGLLRLYWIEREREELVFCSGLAWDVVGWSVGEGGGIWWGRRWVCFWSLGFVHGGLSYLSSAFASVA